jgi:hypothetical protein
MEESLGGDVPTPKLRKKMSLTAADAEYLQEYVKLSEGFLNGQYALKEGKKLLKALNEKFKDQIAAKTLRKTVLGKGLAQPGDGWVPSAVC